MAIFLVLARNSVYFSQSLIVGRMCISEFKFFLIRETLEKPGQLSENRGINQVQD